MPASALTHHDPDQVVTVKILKETLREEFLELGAMIAKAFEQSAKELNEFKQEMHTFKDEMYRFRDEMYAFKDEMNLFKGEIAGDISNVMGELQSIRDEVAILAYRSADHSDRLEELEKLKQERELTN